MKKKTVQHSMYLMAMALAVLFAAAFSSPEAGPAPAARNSGPDLEIIRKRIVDDLLEPAVEPGKIRQLVNTIRPDGSWPGINYTDTTKTGFQHSIHLENMLVLSRAYKKQGSGFYRDAAVQKTVAAALDYWIAHDFICENWWWNEMGTPNLMINTLLLLDSALTDKERTEGARIAGRASLTGFGARAGGDFVPIAGMVCKQGLFKRDEAIFENAVKVMAAQIKFTSDRGIKADLSFNHRTDNVTSIHTYGTNYVSAFSYWAVKTAGTRFSLSESSLKLLIDYYLDGICKSMAYGIYPDPGAKNRDLSRKGSLDAAGTEIPRQLMASTSYRKPELEHIIRIRTGEKKPALTWSRYFWHVSYFANQRDHYFASVRMHSSRQNNVESPYNEEGLKNHHMGDGANFISRTGQEYVDVFPVWDWQKIPGTTVVQRPAMPPFSEIVKKGLTAFSGGVTDGVYGAAAFDFRSVHDPLQARKSWFFFDRGWVCLGAGITSTADYPVATTLNQCLLNKGVVVKTGIGVQTLEKGNHALTGVSWVMHDSVAYLFPAPVSVNVSNATATGNWRQITHQAWATEDAVQKDLFTLWLDHGVKPGGASYAYMVVPGIAPSAAGQYLGKSGISIISNTPQVQAVQNRTANLAEIVFYEPGTVTIGGIALSAGSPCMVMVKTAGKTIEQITVSDPAQQLVSLQLKVSVPVTGSGSNWRAERDKAGTSSTVHVDLPAGEEAGKSVIIAFRKAG